MIYKINFEKVNQMQSFEKFFINLIFNLRHNTRILTENVEFAGIHLKDISPTKYQESTQQE